MAEISHILILGDRCVIETGNLAKSRFKREILDLLGFQKKPPSTFFHRMLFLVDWLLILSLPRSDNSAT